MPNPIENTSLVSLSLGAVILLSTWLPLVVRTLPLSLPIIAVAVGYTLLPTIWIGQEVASLVHRGVLELVTEFIILIALMGAGPRVKRSFSGTAGKHRSGCWALQCR